MKQKNKMWIIGMLILAIPVVFANPVYIFEEPQRNVQYITNDSLWIYDTLNGQLFPNVSSSDSVAFSQSVFFSNPTFSAQFLGFTIFDGTVQSTGLFVMDGQTFFQNTTSFTDDASFTENICIDSVCIDSWNDVNQTGLSSNNITGNGVANKVAYWTNATHIEDSVLEYDSANEQYTLSRSGGTGTALEIEDTGSTTSRLLLNLLNNGASRFGVEDTSAFGSRWEFYVNRKIFAATMSGTGGGELTLDMTGQTNAKQVGLIVGNGEKLTIEAGNGGTNTKGGIGLSFPQRVWHINDTMRIEPRSSAPSSASLGDLYVDSDSFELCFYNSSAWVGLATGGTCS